ncbi:Trans-enoyl reductase fsr4 [Colletotrichum siamense]|nr:Trans-enoyl reductase fsr4 [Colletotrichum siamense]
MKEAIVDRNIQVQLIESPVPTPGPGQVRIKVVVAGSNPKDWKIPVYHGSTPMNTGDDIAGYIDAVGPDVTEFKTGDRVSSMHQPGAPHGAYAEYSISGVETTFHIPSKTSFEEAATIPLAALTAATLVFRGLKVPEPWALNDKPQPQPLVVWGGASAVGGFAIQYAKRAGFQPIIAIAGRGMEQTRSLLDEGSGDAVLDYRAGGESVASSIRGLLKGTPLRYALDAVCQGDSSQTLANILHPSSAGETPSRLIVAVPLMETQPDKRGQIVPFDMPLGTDAAFLPVSFIYESDAGRDFGFVHARYLGKGLQDGWLKPHPLKVVPGGLAGIESGLKDLREGKASGMKFVYRIEETPGL